MFAAEGDRMMSKRGYSLLEVMLAASILASSILLVFSVFTMLFNGSQKTVDMTAGTTIAQSLMTQEIYQLTGDTNTRIAFFQDNAYSLPQAINGGTYTLNNSQYCYKFTCQDVTLPVKLHCQATDCTNNSNQTHLRELHLVVWWWDAKATGASDVGSMQLDASHPGAGQLQVSMTRLLWPTAP